MTPATHGDLRQAREACVFDWVLANIAHLRRTCARTVERQPPPNVPGTAAEATKRFLAELSRIERHLRALVRRGTDGDAVTAAEAMSRHVSASARQWRMRLAMEHAAVDVSRPGR